MKVLHFFSLMILFFSLFACGSATSSEKQADERLKEIENLIAIGNWNTADVKIDSIHALFPRMVDKRKLAVAFSDTISRRRCARTLVYCDSLLQIRKVQADSLKAMFRFEKDEKYQEVGNYVYKTQITEQNAGRNYLKSYVDEKGVFYLVSNVSGTKLKHKDITVSAAGKFATTVNDSLAKGVFHSFNTDGQYFESLTFSKADAGIGGFVAANRNEKIKVTLEGDRKLEYQLLDADKRAIEATYHFWIVLNDIFQLEKEILKAQVRIGNINLRHSF
ncbi:MAG: hypothetical protein JXR27_05135 [Paludibacteraceae bacterium]|nr:hypothetical protein [Paludibacteraceae bacterium]